MLFTDYFQQFSVNVNFALLVRGPVFDYEPPSRVDFDNSTGAAIRCSAKGQPIPDTWWETKNGSVVHDIPGLQHIRPDSSLVFAPFSPHQYRREIHDTIYRCIASNVAGKLGSREVKVRAGEYSLYLLFTSNVVVSHNLTRIFRTHTKKSFTSYQSLYVNFYMIKKAIEIIALR